MARVYFFDKPLRFFLSLDDGFNLVPERWHLGGHDIPDNVIIHSQIVVDQRSRIPAIARHSM